MAAFRASDRHVSDCRAPAANHRASGQRSSSTRRPIAPAAAISWSI